MAGHWRRTIARANNHNKGAPQERACHTRSFTCPKTLRSPLRRVASAFPSALFHNMDLLGRWRAQQDRSHLQREAPALLSKLPRMVSHRVTWVASTYNQWCAGVAGVHPRFVVGWFGLSTRVPTSLRSISHAPCFRMSHSDCDVGGLTKPHTSVHSLGIPPRLHNGEVPGGTGSFSFLKRFFEGSINL